jgi:hypothetical protein
MSVVHWTMFHVPAPLSLTHLAWYMGCPEAQLVYVTAELSDHTNPHLQVESPPQTLQVNNICTV